MVVEERLDWEYPSAIHLWPAAPTVKEPAPLTDYHQRENPYVMEQIEQMEYPPLQLTP